MKEVVFYAIVFVFSTLAISSALTTLIVRTYYTFDMYFFPVFLPYVFHVPL